MTPRTKAQMFIQTLRDMVEADRAIRWTRQMRRNIADATQYRQVFPAGRFELPVRVESLRRQPVPAHAIARVLRAD